MSVLTKDFYTLHCGAILKLDGVGPVENRPSTDKLHHFVKKKEKIHVTYHTWHVTRDMWHVTRCDTWQVTCLAGWSFSQTFSFLALTVCDLWYYEDLEEKDELMNELINYEAVYRTAPATPGLLITLYAVIPLYCNNLLNRYINIVSIDFKLFFCALF